MIAAVAARSTSENTSDHVIPWATNFSGTVSTSPGASTTSNSAAFGSDGARPNPPSARW